MPRASAPASSATRGTRGRPSLPRDISIAMSKDSATTSRAHSIDAPVRTSATCERQTGERVPQRGGAKAGQDALCPLPDRVQGRRSHRAGERQHDKPIGSEARSRAHGVGAAARRRGCERHHVGVGDGDIVRFGQHAIRSPAPVADASAAITGETTPAPGPTTSTLARAATHASRKTAIERDIAAVRTCSSRDASVVRACESPGPAVRYRRPDRDQSLASTEATIEDRLVGSRRSPDWLSETAHDASQRLFARERRIARGAARPPRTTSTPSGRVTWTSSSPGHRAPDRSARARPAPATRRPRVRPNRVPAGRRPRFASPSPGLAPSARSPARGPPDDGHARQRGEIDRVADPANESEQGHAAAPPAAASAAGRAGRDGRSRRAAQRPGVLRVQDRAFCVRGRASGCGSRGGPGARSTGTPCSSGALSLSRIALEGKVADGLPVRQSMLGRPRRRGEGRRGGEHGPWRRRRAPRRLGRDGIGCDGLRERRVPGRGPSVPIRTGSTLRNRARAGRHRRRRRRAADCAVSRRRTKSPM